MGFRLHAQIKHEIEYGSTEAFNYAQEDIDAIISDLCPTYWSDDMDSTYPTNYEIDKEEFAKMISTIEDMTDEYFAENYNTEIPRNEVLVAFKDFLKESENNGKNWVFLTWF